MNTASFTPDYFWGRTLGDPTAGAEALNRNILDFAATGQVVPEPARMILLGTGLLGIAGAARLRRRNEELKIESE